MPRSTARRGPGAIGWSAPISASLTLSPKRGIDRRDGRFELTARVVSFAYDVAQRISERGAHGRGPGRAAAGPANRLYIIHGLGRGASLEPLCLCRDALARRYVQAVAQIEILLIVGAVDPEPLHKLFGGVEMLGLRADLGPESTDRNGRRAAAGQLRPGQYVEVVVQGVLYLRHRPQPGPLHGGQPLDERRGIRPVCRCAGQQRAAAI